MKQLLPRKVSKTMYDLVIHDPENPWRVGPDDRELVGHLIKSNGRWRFRLLGMPTSFALFLTKGKAFRAAEKMWNMGTSNAP